MANSMEGQETVHSVCGPLCHSIADMRLFMTSVLAEKPWSYDSKVIPLEWRQSEEDAIKAKISSRQLTLGFYKCDGRVCSLYHRILKVSQLIAQVLPHPPILRGIQLAVDSLQKAGHTVLSWEPYKHPFAVELIGKIYASDGGKVISFAYATDIVLLTLCIGYRRQPQALRRTTHPKHRGLGGPLQAQAGNERALEYSPTEVGVSIRVSLSHPEF